MKRIILTVMASFILTAITNAQTFTLRSKEIGGQGTKKQEFNGFGCEGANVSPQLSWENAPEGTKSFAVTVYDPDAPTGSGFWHWMVFNIPASVKELVSGAGSLDGKLLPANAVQSITDYGIKGFGGPCPPVNHGPHRYIFTVYALKADKLDIDSNTNPAVVGFNFWSNTIQKASIVMYYERKK
ncbi:YbhB/YbcL family Raf kinase inhibitor-like protein [Pedobacter sp. HMWF019]|uniref:YbhB/YbcL family Raf kinase inhibitor-like protein n=1 Tax=Pedobacter sp. HMWF019 TaxID=2056856 RepID=UPI000D34B9D4|nr:YbhB/YbcL family Raf kinase inhibitor-like protein [Pedobacter sp. HMWF019]PTT00878.1 YbhB/YbcL family Raf kinase inhibitor-like protein [Pedobacter sp. HMWF019]